MKRILNLFIVTTISFVGLIFINAKAASITIGFSFGNGDATCTETTDTNGNSVQKCDMKLTILEGHII